LSLSCRPALLALALLAAGAAQAASSALDFCSRSASMSASQQARLLRFAAVIRDELAATPGSAALISRSGLDLSRFQIRYSHAALAWRKDEGSWDTRQLYYACDESRPRIFDQGVAGFAMGMDDTSLGYISLVRLPPEAAQQLRSASLDTPRALNLLAASYSANAYAFSLRYQNCNQWLAELLAVAWGELADGPDLRERAQRWLKQADYAPEPVDVGSHALMFASAFVPLIHLDDHPENDRFALKLRVSLPSSLEAFIRQRVPGSERIEICHNSRHIVIRQGWTPIAEGCQPGPDDRVLMLD
jgi:hypothetical protein